MAIRFYDDFDPTILAIFYCALDRETFSYFVGGISKPDSLNAATEEQNCSDHVEKPALFDRDQVTDDGANEQCWGQENCDCQSDHHCIAGLGFVFQSLAIVVGK